MAHNDERADQSADAPAEPPPRPTDEHREPLPPPPDEPAELIDTPEALARWVERIHECSSVAIDTEANSMFVYREQTCILQITAGGHSAIVDVLAVEDLSSLRAALDRDDLEVIFHGGDYDITVLTRDHDFRFVHVFDTMIAATLLGDTRVGLAALVEDHFGDTLNKKYQRADWGRRPLTEEQLDYLRRDTQYLPALRDHYQARLEEADLEEEAEIEFRRLATRQGRAASFDPERWRKIKGAAALGDQGRAVLSALFLWREEEAEKRNLPPFKVLAPRTLLALAQKPPVHAKQPHELRAMGERDRRRHGRGVLESLRRALEDARQGRVPPKSLAVALSPEEKRLQRAQRKTEDAIRAWRKTEAEARKVPNAVVLPNPAMVWLIEARPRSLAALAACPDIGPKRTARYGEKLVALAAK
jgi:ribonuclease D